MILLRFSQALASSSCCFAAASFSTAASQKESSPRAPWRHTAHFLASTHPVFCCVCEWGWREVWNLPKGKRKEKKERKKKWARYRSLWRWRGGWERVSWTWPKNGCEGVWCEAKVRIGQGDTQSGIMMRMMMRLSLHPPFNNQESQCHPLQLVSLISISVFQLSLQFKWDAACIHPHTHSHS